MNVYFICLDNYGILITGITESWAVSKNALRHRINLPRNIHFHQTSFFKPSRVMNADDALFAINRAINKINRFHRNDFVIMNSYDLPNLIQSTKKINSYSFEIALHKRRNDFADLLASTDVFPLVSKEYADQIAASESIQAFDKIPIGTGPYQVKEFEPGRAAGFEANRNYHRGLVRIKNLRFRLVQDVDEKVRLLQLGQCDLVTQVRLQDKAKLAAFPTVTIFEKPNLDVCYLAFQT